MITSNDLFDLYYSFLLIRNDIVYELNIEVLEKIYNIILSERKEDNSIRRGLASIHFLDSEKWNFVFYDNLYVYTEFIKDKKTIYVLAKLCQILKELIETKKFDQAYDLVDAIHFIPLLIQKKKNISLRVLKKITKTYTKKWGMLDLK